MIGPHGIEEAMEKAVRPLLDTLDEQNSMIATAVNGWMASVLLGWGIPLADLIACQKEALDALQGVSTALDPTLKVLRTTAFKHSKAFCFACGSSLLLDAGVWVDETEDDACGAPGASEHTVRHIA